MRALTLTQPWATLIALGVKTIETRDWGTGWTGPLAIHAAASIPPFVRDYVERDNPDIGAALTDAGILDWKVLPVGAVVATCNLVRCCPVGPGLDEAPPADQLPFGDFSAGRWMWVLEDIVELDPPVRAKGALGLWHWKQPAGVLGVRA